MANPPKATPEGELDASAGGRRRRGRPSRANGAATRRRLLKTATSMFSAGGYEATSLRQIAGAADVDLATLKYHFGDKPALYAEVYSAGHQAFIEFIAPIMESMAAIASRDELRAHIATLARGVHDFMEAQMTFVRMVLYRFLEDVSEANAAEDELQVVAIGMLEATFEGLKARGIIRPIDSRSFVTMMITGLSMYFVTARVRPHWLGDPDIRDEAGRARAVSFITDLMERALLA